MSYEILPSVDVPLKTGARSTAVVELQTLLRENGFYPTTPDGVVGPKTFQAVYAMWVTLAASPSQSARDLVAGSYVNMTVGQIFNRLSRSLLEHNSYDRALTGSSWRSSETPTYPDQTITFTPQMLAAGLGGVSGMTSEPSSEGSGASPAAWAIGIGLGLAAVGLVTTAARR